MIQMIILATIWPPPKVSSCPLKKNQGRPLPGTPFFRGWVHVSSFQNPSSPSVSRRLPLNLAPISHYSLILNVSTNLSVSVGWKGELCGRPVSFFRSQSIIRVPSCIQHSSLKNPTLELKFFWRFYKTQETGSMFHSREDRIFACFRASWRSIFKKPPLWFFSSRDPLPPPKFHQVSWGARRWATAGWDQIRQNFQVNLLGRFFPWSFATGIIFLKPWFSSL